MEYSPAKRNHYNPCFWTALWNEQFFTDSCAGKTGRGPAREQRVFTLNLRSNKIFTTRVHNIHYDKGLGIAEITTASMLDFCQRRFPDKAENLRRYLAEHPDSLYLDFEATLAGIEQLQGYDALLSITSALSHRLLSITSKYGWRHTSAASSGTASSFALLQSLHAGTKFSGATASAGTWAERGAASPVS